MGILHDLQIKILVPRCMKVKENECLEQKKALVN